MINLKDSYILPTLWTSSSKATHMELSNSYLTCMLYRRQIPKLSASLQLDRYRHLYWRIRASYMMNPVWHLTTKTTHGTNIELIQIWHRVCESFLFTCNAMKHLVSLHHRYNRWRHLKDWVNLNRTWRLYRRIPGVFSCEETQTAAQYLKPQGSAWICTSNVVNTWCYFSTQATDEA